MVAESYKIAWMVCAAISNQGGIVGCVRSFFLFQMHLVKTEKFHGEKDMFCGILIKDKKDFDYFKGYFDNNRLDLRTCNSVSLNTKGLKLERRVKLFNVENQLFGQLVGYCVAILAFAVVVGLLVEGRRYYVRVNNPSGKDMPPL